MTSFNINDFIGKMGTGLLRSNKFLVQLRNCPKALLGTQYQATFQDLHLYCESIGIPGVLLQTNEVKRYGYGPIEKKPYMPAFADAQLVFRSDQDGRVFEFLRKWQAAALNYEYVSDSGGGINVKNGLTNPSQNRTGGAGKPMLTPYELNYKRNYAVDVHVTMFNDVGEFATKIVLRDAYPSLAADMPLAWEMSKAYAQLPVALTFTDLHVWDED